MGAGLRLARANQPSDRKLTPARSVAVAVTLSRSHTNRNGTKTSHAVRSGSGSLDRNSPRRDAAVAVRAGKLQPLCPAVACPPSSLCSSSISPSARDGHRFESPQLHHEVAANRPGFPAPTIPRLFSRAKIWRVVRHDHHEIHPLGACLRDPPRGIKTRAIGIEQQGRHHARIEWRLTKPAFVACDDLRQIQVLARQSDDELRQMVRRHITDDRQAGSVLNGNPGSNLSENRQPDLRVLDNCEKIYVIGIASNRQQPTGLDPGGEGGRLIHDLRQDMGVNEEAIPTVLDLLDQQCMACAEMLRDPAVRRCCATGRHPAADRCRDPRRHASVRAVALSRRPQLAGCKQVLQPRLRGKSVTPGYRFPPEVIHQAYSALSPVHTRAFVTSRICSRSAASRSRTVRRWVNHFGPMIAAYLGKRCPKPHATSAS